MRVKVDIAPKTPLTVCKRKFISANAQNSQHTLLILRHSILPTEPPQSSRDRIVSKVFEIHWLIFPLSHLLLHGQLHSSSTQDHTSNTSPHSFSFGEILHQSDPSSALDGASHRLVPTYLFKLYTSFGSLLTIQLCVIYAPEYIV
jgi:hypothetical protein